MNQKLALLAVVSAIVAALSAEYAERVESLWLPAVEIVAQVAEARR